MQFLSSRFVNVFALLVCVGVLVASAYLQFFVGLAPCPLCVLQRVLLVVVAFVLLVAISHNPGRVGTRIYGGLCLLFSAGGAALAGRQLWLQQLPIDPNASCLPGMAYLFKTMPVLDVLKVSITGSAECARVTWSLLGLSVANWTLITFLFLALMAFMQIKRR